MERILAIQIKRIGDLILTIPALTRLKRNLPGSEITLVTLGAAGQLVPGIQAVDEHLNYRYRRPNLAVWSAILNGGFDRVLDFNGNDRSIFMAFLSGAEIKAGYEKRAEGPAGRCVYTHTSNASLKALHTIDHMTALLDAIGLEPAAHPDPLRLSVPDSVRKKIEEDLAVRGVPEQFSVVHPGTARAEKFWPAEHWAAVIDALASDFGMKTVLTGGTAPEESSHIDRICELCGEKPVVVAGELTLLETAAVIERSSAALGVDTAAMHLAGAFEKPQIVLFGPTPPFHWGPRHRNARVLLAGNENPLAPDQFQPAVAGDSMDRIRPAQVMNAVGDLLR